MLKKQLEGNILLKTLNLLIKKEEKEMKIGSHSQKEEKQEIA